MPRGLIYLALIIPLILIGGVFVYLMIEQYAAWSEIRVGDVRTVNGIPIALATFFLWLPLALMLGNAIFHSNFFLRRYAETYAAATGRPSYHDSQRQLLKILMWDALVFIPALIAGWLL